MEKSHLRLQATEGLVFQRLAQIFAAGVAAGVVNDSNEQEWIRRSVRQAVELAELADDAVISDEEVDSINEKL